MRIKANGLYRTNCGAVIRGIGDYFVVASACPSGECRSRVYAEGSMLDGRWFYDLELGTFGGEEDNEDFHMHVKEEILP